MASTESEPNLPAPAFSPEGGRVGVPEYALLQTLDALSTLAGTAILGTDQDGIINKWSAGAEALYGWTAEEAIGTRITAHAPESIRHDLERVRDNLREGIGVQGWETIRVRKDGTIAHVVVDIAPVRNEAGEVVGGASITRDVTEQRGVEVALGVAEERFRTLVEALPMVTYTVTVEDESKLVYVAPQIEQLLGVKPEDAKPAVLQAMIHPDDRERILGEFSRGNADQESLSLEYRTVRADGTIVWLQDTSVVVPARDGNPPWAQGYLLDISDRKRLEEQLLQSQKMDAVGQLAGGIAHDFNNILTAIEGYSELALDRVGPDDKVRDALLEIRKAAARAATLTGQILAFGRRQLFHSRPIDLNGVIDETKNLVLRLIGEHIEVVTRLEVSLGSVMADPSQLTQVLVNLAVNARDAMPAGGRLTIATANAEIDETAATAVDLEPGAYVALSVTDTGIGMDAETVRRAFEPFFTTKPVGQGSGLGLSTVYGIARQSGGSVSVYSEPGHGTVVRVYLPRIDQVAVAEPVAVTPTRDTERGAGTVLLVEDEQMIRSLVTELLERQGYSVLSAADPLEAIRIADVSSIDLLLTDVVMPHMSGPDLAERLSADRPTLSVLFTSGYPADAVALGGMPNRDAVLLQKPFSAGALIEHVRAALAAV